jgi:hypothetical protein
VKSFFMSSSRTTLQILTDRIRNNIAIYYPGVDPDGIKIRGKRYGGSGTAKTFRFRIREKNRKPLRNIFVKLSPVTEELNWGRAEYDLLTSLYPRISVVEPRCCVPRPLDYYSDLEALILEEVEGKPFRKWFLRQNPRRCQRREDLHKAIADCALWLKTFHGLTHGGQKLFDFVSFVDALQDDVQKLADYGFSMNFIQMVRVLTDRVKGIGQIRLPIAACHNDFTPGHVFISSNGVSVIDIHGTLGEFIYTDLAYWLGSTATINAFPLHLGFDYEHANGPLGKVFLEAYFSDNKDRIPESTAIAYLFKLHYLVQRFFDQREKLAMTIHPVIRPLFSRWRLVRLFTRQLKATMNALEAEYDTLGI